MTRVLILIGILWHLLGCDAGVAPRSGGSSDSSEALATGGTGQSTDPWTKPGGNGASEDSTEEEPSDNEPEDDGGNGIDDNDDQSGLQQDGTAADDDGTSDDGGTDGGGIDGGGTDGGLPVPVLQGSIANPTGVLTGCEDGRVSFGSECITREACDQLPDVVVGGITYRHEALDVDIVVYPDGATAAEPLGRIPTQACIIPSANKLTSQTYDSICRQFGDWVQMAFVFSPGGSTPHPILVPCIPRDNCKTVAPYDGASTIAVSSTFGFEYCRSSESDFLLGL